MLDASPLSPQETAYVLHAMWVVQGLYFLADADYAFFTGGPDQRHQPGRSTWRTPGGPPAAQ